MHDNARPHTARLTLETVEQLGLEVLPHLPYSPDLAASDYHLFGLMKKMLAGQKFASDTEGGAISRSSVAWTAASIVLCIGHSEAC